MYGDINYRAHEAQEDLFTEALLDFFESECSGIVILVEDQDCPNYEIDPELPF